MQSLALNDVPVGSTVRIEQLTSQPEFCSRLREMGFCENALVRCIAKGSGNIICEICNCRIGLNSSIARSIFVSSF